MDIATATKNYENSKATLATLRAAGHEAKNTKKWQTAVYNHGIYTLRAQSFLLVAR